MKLREKLNKSSSVIPAKAKQKPFAKCLPLNEHHAISYLINMPNASSMNRHALTVLVTGLSLTLLPGCSIKREATTQKNIETAHIQRDTTNLSINKDIIITDSDECVIKHFSFYPDTSPRQRQIKDITLVRVNRIKTKTSQEIRKSEKKTTDIRKQKASDKSYNKNDTQTKWPKTLALIIILFTIILIIRKL